MGNVRTPEEIADAICSNFYGAEPKGDYRGDVEKDVAKAIRRERERMDDRIVKMLQVIGRVELRNHERLLDEARGSSHPCALSHDGIDAQGNVKVLEAGLRALKGEEIEEKYGGDSDGRKDMHRAFCEPGPLKGLGRQADRLRREDGSAADALRLVAHALTTRVILADDAEALRNVAEMLERRHEDV